jgi:hypothetical protein
MNVSPALHFKSKNSKRVQRFGAPNKIIMRIFNHHSHRLFAIMPG